MGLKESVGQFVVNFFIERPARNMTLGELATSMQSSGQKLNQRFSSKSDSERNRNQMRHIIGIERWGQRRLRVPLGEPPVRDEYDGYAPPADSSWPDLLAAFRETRAGTVALAQELERAGVTREQTIPHNQLGALSPHAWLVYLRQHGTRESNLVR